MLTSLAFDIAEVFFGVAFFDGEGVTVSITPAPDYSGIFGVFSLPRVFPDPP